MAVIEIAKIQVRRGQELQTGIPQLDPGELGWAEDTQHLYIGKRIAEGANTDENTRILTEPDLENIFNLINSTSSNILKYQYRDNVAYINTSSVVRTAASKLNDSVSITDFGVVPSSTATDITTAFRLAVNTIFQNLTWDSIQRQDARRNLLIPAGNYILSNSVELPPYTRLVGEGPGLTNITFVNSTTNMFTTVDALGNRWNAGMSSGVKRSRDVHVEGMTLQYAVTATSDYALLSVDNSLDATVKNIEFRTAIDSTSTTTYGLVSHGVGIRVRGQGSGVASGDSALCQNVQIKDCRFDSLLTGIESTGSVIKPTITNNFFNNLDRGVKMSTTGIISGPSNGYILDNRFQNIVREAIFVGTQTNKTNHISENNFFVQVGNGTTLDDTTSSTASSVISFYGTGDRSINDYFYRQLVANETVNPNFYYNPLVTGSVAIVNNSVFTATLALGVDTETIIARFPLLGKEQKIDVDYKLFDLQNKYVRTGRLLVNVSKPTSPEGAFNLASATPNATSVLYLSTINDNGYIIEPGDTISCVGVTTGTTVSSVNTLTNQITMSAPSTALIPINTTATFVKIYDSYGSISDYYNYSYVPEWIPTGYPDTYGDPDTPVFSISDPAEYAGKKKNYVELTFTNWRDLEKFSLEYQISKST